GRRAPGEAAMTPVLAGRARRSLLPQAGERALEIGTGSGYLTACPARRAREVTSIERHADLAEAARARLDAQGIANAEVVHADAFAWEPGRDFDAICVTGALDEVPVHFID